MSINRKRVTEKFYRNHRKELNLRNALKRGMSAEHFEIYWQAIELKHKKYIVPAGDECRICKGAVFHVRPRRCVHCHRIQTKNTMIKAWARVNRPAL